MTERQIDTPAQEPAAHIDFPYQRTFDAIVAATSLWPTKAEPSGISVSVQKFVEAFNSAADRTPAGSEKPGFNAIKREEEICALEAEVRRLREDLEALRAAPTKEEVELRLEVARLRKEADTAHAEVVHTQDELGALLHAAEAKLAQALSQVEDARKQGMSAAFEEVAQYLQIQGLDTYALHIKRRGQSLSSTERQDG